jgi:hypothetical protein
MYLEYKYNLDRDTARGRIDRYVEKLENLQFAGGFAVEDLKKSWTGDEMQFSFNLKKMIIDRRIKGNFRLKGQVLIMDFEVPDIVKNFVTEDKIEETIRKNLDTILAS